MPLTRTFISDSALWSWARKPAPTGGFFVCLSIGSSFTPSSTIADFLASEVSGNGYTRQPLTYTADGVYSTANNRHEMPQLTPQFTAAGGSIVWRTAFVLYGARSESRISIPAANVNITTNVITTTAAHGLVAGERVMFTDGSLFGIPEPLTVNTIYLVLAVPTATTFTLATVAAPTVQIDITTAPGGPYNLHYANGGVRSYVIQPSNETITIDSSGQITYDTINIETAYL